MNSKDFLISNLSKQVEFLKNGLAPVVPYFFTTLEIELSNFCNLDCPFCYTSSLTRKRLLFPFEAYKKLVDYMDGKKLKPRISFSGDGEMFIHKQILDFVEYAKERDFHVQIINNGTLCTPEKSKALIKMGLDRIQFSVDSIKKESYEKSRRQKGNGNGKNFFESVRLNVLEYIRLNYEFGEPTNISIMSVQTEENKKESEAFKNYWYQFPIHNVFLSPLYTLAGNSVINFEEARRIQYTGGIEGKPVCVSPFVLLCIKVDGKVLACTHDSDAVFPIGNIIENGDAFDSTKNGEKIDRTIAIDKLWNNERVQNLRKGLLRGELDYFKTIGHDCISCNCPIEGGSIEEYQKGKDSSKITKIWESMNREDKKIDLNNDKYLNLVKELDTLKR
ncbi:MAG: radical SAM protein [Candidatus Brocadiales bacterium]|nr:radical SAM protein [Candidatus Brocadiales bacterium]